MTEATLFVGGRIHTGAGYGEALAIEDGRVLVAGPEEVARRAVPTGADRVELEGRLVVPGLADAHLHLGELGRARLAFDASSARSVVELRDGLGRWAASHPDGPIVGRGLSLDRLAERRFPSLAELDAAVPSRPLVLLQASGHAAALNSTALDVAYRGRSPSEAEGAPPSVVVEEALEALRPILAEALPVTLADLEAVVTALAAFGLTTVGTMNTSPEELSALGDLASAGRLAVRVRAYPPLSSVGTLAATPTTARGAFAVVGVKGFLDGAFGPRTAALDEPYDDDPAQRGLDRRRDEEFAAALAEAGRRGLQPALHAIGDRAVARAIRLLGQLPHAGPSPRIEHASLTPPALLAPLARLGAQVVVQPGFVVSDTWLGSRLGPERTRFAYLFRTFRELGVPVAGSSDAPFDPPDPWLGIRAAVLRRDRLGRSANPRPDQALPVDEALALYTEGAHRAIGEPGGDLRPGARADLVVLDVHQLPAMVAAGSAAVRETWIAGRPVYRRGGEVGAPDMATPS